MSSDFCAENENEFNLDGLSGAHLSVDLEVESRPENVSQTLTASIAPPNTAILKQLDPSLAEGLDLLDDSMCIETPAKKVKAG